MSVLDEIAAERRRQIEEEVRQVILSLEAIARAPYSLTGFGDAYRHIGINFSLEACEIAARITGANGTFCKMLNHKFRTDAANLMFERACSEVA